MNLHTSLAIQLLRLSHVGPRPKTYTWRFNSFPITNAYLLSLVEQNRIVCKVKHMYITSWSDSSCYGKVRLSFSILRYCVSTNPKVFRAIRRTTCLSLDEDLYKKVENDIFINTFAKNT